MRNRPAGWLFAAVLIVAAVLAGWWVSRPDPDRIARTAFRDDVIAVIGARFARTAVPVSSDPGTIEIGAARRDIRPLYDVAGQLAEQARRQKIYLWFLGDPETASRVVVREQPFEVPATQPHTSSTQVHLDGIDPKPVKTLSVRPDGSMVGSGQAR